MPRVAHDVPDSRMPAGRKASAGHWGCRGIIPLPRGLGARSPQEFLKRGAGKPRDLARSGVMGYHAAVRNAHTGTHHGYHC